ncbi:MAG: AsmA family protein [Candidatus Parcubacteria bacterium]|nr:AsmA family protein [Burkholderiales bacterium]
MNSKLRILLYGLAGLATLAVVALLVMVLVIDGNFVKSRMQDAMKAKNRTLVIEGEPKLRLFPVASLALGKASLSEPGSDKLFLSLDSAEAALRVMPLLSGEVALEALRLSGAKVNVIRRKDGSMNFADLTDAKRKDAPPEEPPNLRIAGITVDKLQIAYRDEVTGQELNVMDASLKTGRLDGETPGDVSLAARITGRKPDVDLRAQGSGALRFNLAKEEFAFDKFSAQLKGRYDQDTIAAEFTAPKLEVTPAKASGTEVKASIQVKGPQRNVDARLLIAAVEGSAKALTIPKIALDLEAAVSGISTKSRFEASLKANLAKQDLQAEVSGRVDDSPLKAKVELTKFAPLKAKFDLSIERLNADRYLPAERKDGKGDEPIDLAVLRGKDVSGKIAIGALTALRVKLENVKADVKLAGGKLEVAPHSASLYGGTLSGALSADASGNRVQVKENLQNVAVGPLLRDYARKDMLEGRGNVTLDVQTAGISTLALKRALAGSARVNMNEGAIKGVNLTQGARSVGSALGVKTTRHDPSQKTDFSELSASFAIKNGVARNDDLKVLSSLLRVGGAGNLDIGNNRIDYQAKAILAAGGLTVPVKLSGALDSPEWQVDYSALVGNVAGGAAGSIKDLSKKGVGGVSDAVRGIFKR